jgi:hypothetical protein
MNFEEFKKELSKQIGLNSKYFKPNENLILLDFLGTINEDDFKEIKE